MTKVEKPEMKFLRADGQYNKKVNVYDIYLKLQCGKEFDDLTFEDIECLNTEVIKPDDDILVGKNKDGTTYLGCLYIGETQPELISFQLSCEKRFKRCVKRIRGAKYERS